MSSSMVTSHSGRQIGPMGEEILMPIMIKRGTDNRQNLTRTHTTTTPNGTNNLNTGSGNNAATQQQQARQEETQRDFENFSKKMKAGRQRLSTFTSGRWPVLFLSPITLAEAGFFYLNDTDRVQCAFCHTIVKNWVQGDVPIMEHLRHYPRCPFLQGYDVGNMPIEDDPVRGRHRLLPQSFDVCGNFNFMTNQVEPMSSSEEEMNSDEDVPMESNLLTQENAVSSDDDHISYSGIINFNGPKFPMMSSIDARKRSFSSSWMTRYAVSPDDLAEAGFYSLGDTDMVKCFHCGGGLCSWEPTDDPWTEHRRVYPDCPFVQLNMPPPAPVPRNIQEDADEAVSGWLNTDIVMQLFENYSFSKNIIKNVLRQKFHETGRPFSNFDQLHAAVSAAAANPLATGSHRVSESEDDEQAFPSQESVLSSASSAGSDDERSARLTCKICLDREVGMIFLPCAHLVACTRCGPAMDKCPYCREPVKQAIRTFLA